MLSDQSKPYTSGNTQDEWLYIFNDELKPFPNPEVFTTPLPENVFFEEKEHQLFTRIPQSFIVLLRLENVAEIYPHAMLLQDIKDRRNNVILLPPSSYVLEKEKLLLNDSQIAKLVEYKFNCVEDIINNVKTADISLGGGPDGRYKTGNFKMYPLHPEDLYRFDGKMRTEKINSGVLFLLRKIKYLLV